MKKGLILIICGLLAVTMLNAQQAATAILRGKITDTDGQALIGATVLVSGTMTGSTADIDGNYILPKVSVGKHTIEFSYVGYENATAEVVIKEGKTNELNIELEATSFELGEVEISSSFQSVQRAVNYQRNSKNLRNVVSADQVGRFPDANIGDAMKRISGINVQYDQGEARFGQIRGTSPEFSSVTVNGNRVPSAESGVRSVQLDLIPSDMVQTVVVNKVVTADMDGDAIGGTVDLVTKNSPTRRIISASLGSGWNGVSEKAQLTGAFTYGDRITDKWGFIASASYQNNPIGSDNTEFEWVKNDKGENYVEDFQIRKYLVHRERQSYSLSTDYKFNANNRIDFKAIYNRRNDWENRFRFRLKDMNEEGVAKSVIYQTKGGASNVRDARLERQQVMDFALNGEHLLGRTLMDWNVSYAQASEDRPDERYLAYKAKGVQFNSDYSSMKQPNFTPKTASDINIDNGSFKLDELTEKQQAIMEKDFKARLNFTLPLLVGMRSGSLKFGGKFVNKRKTADYDYHDYTPLNSDFDANMFKHQKQAINDGYLAGDYHVGNFITEETLGGLDLNNPALFEKKRNVGELGKIFNATENIAAAYVRYDQQLSDKWSMVAGVRAEATMLENQGVVLSMPEEGEPTLSDGEKGTNDYVSILPSLLLSYTPNKNAVVRASYTRTLVRPNYFDVVPYVNIHGEDNEVSLGNNTLKPTYSNNIDLSMEYYFPNFGQVTLGGYYKSVNDIIVRQVWDNKEYKNHVYDHVKQSVNGGDADILGVEVSLQRDFSFIAHALRHLGVYANYTYTHSRIRNFNIDREDASGAPLTGETLRMPGSPEHITNASLYYENKGINIRASYNFASDFIDEFGSSRATDRFYDNVSYLDINASYTFKKHYTVFAEATNLLNQPLRYYQESSQYTAQSEYYAPRFNFGIRYTL